MNSQGQDQGQNQGQIPQSEALAEAEVNSLTELLSRDPEGYQKQNRTTIVSALRAMRAKWEKGEASKPKSGEKSSGKTSPLLLVSAKSPEELDL